MIKPEFGWWRSWVSSFLRWRQRRNEIPTLGLGIPKSWQEECDDWDRKHPNGIEDCFEDHDC